MPRVKKLLRRGGPTLQIGWWAARTAMAAWNRLEPDERSELWALTRKSHGRRSALSKHERRRLVDLVKRAARERGR